MTIEPKSVILWHFKRIWCAHRRLYPSSSLLLQFFTYPTTLANEFNLASLWQLPLLLFRITIKRFRYMISDRFAMFFFMLITLFSVLSYSPLATALNNSDDGISVDDFRVLNREQLLSSINELVSQNKIEEACQLYQYFDCLLVDESIIEHSNGLIDKLRETGRQIIATTDPLREPKDNELVIVYGNYHHAHNNLPYSNKIWRHPLYFKDLKHSKFEYDPAWESIGVVYILNLEERVDRYMEILSELCRVRAPLNRICHYKVKRESITGDKSFDAHASCTKNHGNMVEDFLKGIHQTCLILEDDVTFTADIEGNLKRLKLFFDRQYDYEVCLLNSSKYHEIKEYDDLLLLSYQECTTCSAYLLNRKGAEKVLFYFRDGYEKLIKLRTTHYVCDRYWAEMQKNNKFFLFKTKFGYQRCSFSSTTGNTECHFD